MIKSRNQLKKYILTKLGSPVINIELVDEQIDICINETIEDFIRIAYSGMLERYIPVQLINKVQDYILPNSVFSVIECLEGSGLTQSSPDYNPFHINQFIAADIYKGNVGSINLLNYELTMEYLETLNIVMGVKKTFDFNTHSKKLHFHAVPKSNEKIVIRVHLKLEPDEILDPSTGDYIDQNNVYDIIWIKKMATEKCRYQWAVNLMKYSGSTLPNGNTINVDGIMNEAKENIEKLNEQLENSYQLPPDFFVG